MFNSLQKTFKEAISISADQKALIITADQLIALLTILKKEQGFNMLAALTAVEHTDNYEMIYHLMSLETADIVTIKVIVPKSSPKAPSIVTLWAAANVQEREVYDMFGIIIEGHPNLKRILNPDEYTEFPLRKSLVLTSVDRQTTL